MGSKSVIPSGEALGALPPLNACWRFMNLHTHLGRGTEETETVIAAFAPDWLGHLRSSSAAKQHLPYLHAITGKGPGSSSRDGFRDGTPMPDWTTSVHNKERLRTPATKVV